jgi:hypothetical protein
MKSFSQKTVLITGASAGLGMEFARQLAPTAKALILVARRIDLMRKLQEELQSQNRSLKIDLLPFDLSEPEPGKRLLEWTNQNGMEIDFLINNAGFGDSGTFATSDWNKIRSMIAVNVTALTAITHAFLPQLRKRKGAILNVASIAGVIPLPDLEMVYAATKAYVCSFSEGLYIELKKEGVTVTSLCPGPVETEFGKAASRPDSAPHPSSPSFFMVSPQKVVSDALAGVLTGKARVIPGWPVGCLMLLLEILPAPFLRFILESIGRLKKGSRT